MIKNITVTNHLGESMAIELRFPEKSGFLVRSIEGLGPSKADINMTEVLSNDGSFYNSARVTSRNILFMLSFLSSSSIESVRQKSYKFFPIKRRIEIEIETDNRICKTYGFVESNDPNIFSKEEGTNISVICPDSYFRSKDNNVTIFSGTESLFEFPFSNESLNSNLIEFGNIQTKTEKTVIYNGDASVGVTIYIHAIGPATDLTISNTRTRELMSISSAKLSLLTGHGIIAGDDIVISTVKGNKFINLIRDGVTINILNCLNRDADWFELEKGDNLFAYVTEYGSTNLQFRIENENVYEGI